MREVVAEGRERAVQRRAVGWLASFFFLSHSPREIFSYFSIYSTTVNSNDSATSWKQGVTRCDLWRRQELCTGFESV